ncbi:hypothetical protein BH23GEM11_BH23GEM11_17220 [soil metagenome]
MRWIRFSLLFAGIAGCDTRGPGDAVAFSAERADWVADFCGLADDGFRGVASEPPGQASPDTILQLDVGRVAAIATSPGGMIAVYNDMAARVVGLDETGVLVEFGRTGSGPGEFSAPPVGTERDHVSVSGRSFLVFDGYRFLEFDLAGRPLHAVQGAVLGFARIHSVGLRSTPEAHFVGVMEWSMGSPERRLEVYRWTEGILESVGGVALTPLARLPSGSWTWRRFIPMPLWDVAGECAILSDGWSPELVVLHLQSGEHRSLRVSGHLYPDRELLRIQAAEQEETLVFTRERNLPFSEVEFSEPRRWSGLRYSRDGSLWLWPSVAPGDAPAALRIPLQPSALDAHLVEVAASPAAFLPGGVPLFLAHTHGEGWSDVVVRLGPAPGLVPANDVPPQ